MTPQFRERYISREEHNSIVAYYKKLVVQLHRTANRKTATGISEVCQERRGGEDCWTELGDMKFCGSATNVIKLTVRPN
ncbi:hypothetical protein DEM27_27825 [Metarhizobium album]|uniref:Uncharacterized protein n=1 Tax=Metarhizobium album TaxID=2182425 RepID=A0A2U2DHW2_9HYPH|nr:hypothetical protein [Rhizobium album]PWE52907.1 hypothetical protein DEM27_27825 [Rhizobium album]